MKKIAATLVAILSVLVLALSLASCEGEIGKSGKYKFESLTVSVMGVETTLKAGEEYFGQTLTEDWFVLELKKDGTCVIKAEGDEAETGTWTEKDGVITFNVSGVSIGKATKDGNRLTFSYGSNLKVTLKK